MRLKRLLPKSYTNQLIMMMFIFGLVPFIIFGFLINAFDHRFRLEMDKTIEQRQAEEERLNIAILSKMAEETVRQKALDVALQLTLYLEAHSDMTLAQLRKTPEFRKIAVQPMFETGYTVVLNATTGVILFHQDPKFENLDLSTLTDKPHGVWLIVQKSLGGKHAFGYYEWANTKGALQTKYMHVAPVTIETADRVPLVIAATAYVDEFTQPITISHEAARDTSRHLTAMFQQFIRTVKQKGFLFLGIGLVTTLGLAYWAGTFFSITIVYLRRATKAVIDGWLDVRVKSNIHGDMGDLAEDFNRMVTHLRNTTVTKDALEANQRELRETNTLLYREVQERQQAETALRETGERLRAILETNPNPIVIYSNEGVPEYVNKAFYETFGWSLEELKEQNLPFIPEALKEEALQKIDEVAHSEKVVKIESQRLTHQGKIIDVLISAAPIKGPLGDVAGMVVNYADISEVKQLKERLIQAQKMESIGTLAGGIAHNFNNVLMGIVGTTSLMLMQKDPSDPDHRHLTAIEQYSNNAAELTSALLAFARGGQYQIAPTNLNQLVQYETQLFGRTKKELTISETYDKNLWNVEVDQGQMRQVVLNLYVNALQAMPGGGDLYVTTENLSIDETYITPFEVKPGRYVKVSITDTGVGMDEETKEKIFEPFFTTRTTGSGTGLGLASVYGIIKNHNGFINVYSEVGAGATFNIYIPASDKKVTAALPLAKPIVKGAENILLVDDEEIIIDVGAEILKSLGYQVLEAKNGKEALSVYGKHKDDIDIVIMDMIMPGMGGLELYSKLKENNPAVKVLLSSGYSLNSQAREILNRGCNGFIQKPFNLDQMSQKLRKILDEA